MAFKEYDIEHIGLVKIYKRRASRSMRLSIQPDGSVRVSIPAWTPYAAGVTFARSRQEWIRKHTKPMSEPLRTGQGIGKQHRLLFMRSLDARRVSSRLRRTEIVITHPIDLEASDDAVQTVARRACLRALRSEAEELLPARIAALATLHNLPFGTLTIKPLKTRWGSCDQDKNITLNIYLMQLPWHLIDYVLLHELTHTRIMRHGPPFWEAMAELIPTISAVRKEMRDHRSALQH